jgi:arylsulfatase A-like enzyme
MATFLGRGERTATHWIAGVALATVVLLAAPTVSPFGFTRTATAWAGTSSPKVTGFTPRAGAVGRVVTISGAGFAGTTSVTFQGVESAFTVVSDTEVSATVPAGALTGAIAVATPRGLGTTSKDFKVRPKITALTPSRGNAGTAVVVAGKAFTDATAVMFNGVDATFTVDSYAQITAIVPSGATTGAVRVTTAGGKSTMTANSTFLIPPNILLLVADDQSLNTFTGLMPTVQSRLIGEGVQFTRAYVNESACCPSRSEILTGLYGQHAGVDQNDVWLTRPTITEALQASGYRTMMAGKYLNSEPCDPQPQFDEWVCTASDPFGYTLVDPRMDVNGTTTRFTGFTTDILASYVADWIQGTPSDQPFFAMYTPPSPHLPANDPRCQSLPVAPVRDVGYYDDTLTDGKPLYMQRAPYSSSEAATVDQNHQAMTQAVTCLDGSIATILDALGSREANTLVIYLSDNGYLYGEHHRDAKGVPYEESMHVPFVIRYPPVVSEAQPFTTDELVENVDIAPTIADVAGIRWQADGVSLVSILERQATSVRDGALIEYCEGASFPCPGHAYTGSIFNTPSFFGIVTAGYKYVEYTTGEKELYDLTADPSELTNLASDPAHASLQSQLATQLGELLAPPEPDTTILSGPVGSLGERVATFAYFSQSRRATYRCRLDMNGASGAWLDCSGQRVTVGGLLDGAYSFEVEATDELGQTDPSPDTRSFVVSSSGPDAEITSSPEAHQRGNTLSFGVATGTAGASLRCSMEPLGTPPAFGACGSATPTYGPLADGLWDFQVEAVDQTGSTTTPPAEWLTNVDRLGPTMTFDLTPGATSGPGDPQIFDFAPSEPIVGPITCALDATPPVDCSTGHFDAGTLAVGQHSLSVTATDVLGNMASTTSTWSISMLGHAHDAAYASI